jgi:hypothetical protein
MKNFTAGNVLRWRRTPCVRCGEHNGALTLAMMGVCVLHVQRIVAESTGGVIHPKFAASFVASCNLQEGFGPLFYSQNKELVDAMMAAMFHGILHAYVHAPGE